MKWYLLASEVSGILKKKKSLFSFCSVAGILIVIIKDIFTALQQLNANNAKNMF